MRDPARIPRLLQLLEAYWRRTPDQRLGQLLLNACRELCCDWPDVWTVEDSSLEAELRRLLRGDT